MNVELHRRLGYVTPTEIDTGLGEDLDSLRIILAWLRSFLAKSNPQLGRAGPVCPKILGALGHDVPFMKVVRFLQPPSADQLEAVVGQFQDDFDALEPSDGASRQYMSTALIFPDLSDAEIDLVKYVRRKMKTGFLRTMKMVALCDPSDMSPGMHNPGFYPYQSPIPVLAARRLEPTAATAEFLSRSSDPSEVRALHLRIFLGMFAETMDRGLMQVVMQKLVEIDTGTPVVAQPRRCPFHHA